MVQFAILGSLELRDGDVAVALGGVRERSLLALLLLNANELVSTDRIVDELWGDRPPKAAVKTVQVYVSRLRKILGADALATRPPGYVLHVDDEQFDLRRFERLAAEGRHALSSGDLATARRLLREALALWRGAPCRTSSTSRSRKLRRRGSRSCVSRRSRTGSRPTFVPGRRRSSCRSCRRSPRVSLCGSAFVAS